MDAKEFSKGIEIEHEHAETFSWLKAYVKKHNKFPEATEFYAHIAENHLSEKKDYYTCLVKAGL